MSYTPPGSLVPLFGDSGFTTGDIRQGRLTAWDSTTLANTVVINSQSQTNLAVLAPAVSDLTAPCTVLLIPFASTYVIAGRIRVPA